MPAMPRTSSKATKIFYNILGKPSNADETKHRKKVRKRLIQEEGRLVR